MANTDEHGNKIATKKIKKTVVSRRIRERRITTPGSLRNPKFCGDCGYRIRGEKHTEGSHHNG